MAAAAEAAAEGFYLTQQRGEVRSRGRHSQTAAHPYPVPAMPSSDPYVQYYAQEDKRVPADSRCGGPRYPSWPNTHFPPAASVHPPSYPSTDSKAFAYGMPGGVAPPPMHIPGHALPMLPAPGHMVTPQPPMFGIAGLRTSKSRGRADSATESSSSSSNCTPRDHYGSEKSQHRRHKRNDGSPRLPVVKIPETLKKLGQPSPAPWLNSRGFPLRMGKPDCKHYITKGWCAYGTLCKFNHPDSATTSAAMPCAVIPSYPGSQPAMVSAPWGVGMPSYPWGAWNHHQPQQHHHHHHQMYAPAAAVPHGACYPAPAYMCPYPNPCPTESNNSTSTSNLTGGGESDKATDADSLAMYNSNGHDNNN